MFSNFLHKTNQTIRNEAKQKMWSIKLSLNCCRLIDWLSSVLRPLQHSIGYMGDGFYRSKDPTNSIKVLKQEAVKEKKHKQYKENRKYTHTK